MVTHKDFIIIIVTESADRTTLHFFTIFAFGNSEINHPMVCFVIKKKITFLFCLNAIHVTVAVFKEAMFNCKCEAVGKASFKYWYIPNDRL